MNLKTFFKRIKREESGNAILFVGLALMTMIAFLGLVIDGGKLYMTKQHLQKTANAAVLSGAQELTNTEAAVSEVVSEVIAAHQEETSVEALDITMEKRVSIDLKNNVSLSFSKLFGMESAPVEAHAAAELRTMGRAMGAAPLGIDERNNLEYYQEYKLKVDQTEVEYGNFGVLALGGTGAQTYEYNLRYGYDSELKVGDILETQTGNISGKTRSVIDERLTSCPYQPYDTTHRDCSRIILIPVYKPYFTTTNQLKEVEIRGFAYFYITEPMSNNDTSITGMFIKRAGTGFEYPDAANKGAYSIRLTE